MILDCKKKIQLNTRIFSKFKLYILTSKQTKFTITDRKTLELSSMTRLGDPQHQAGDPRGRERDHCDMQRRESVALQSRAPRAEGLHFMSNSAASNQRRPGAGQVHRLADALLLNLPAGVRSGRATGQCGERLQPPQDFFSMGWEE